MNVAHARARTPTRVALAFAAISVLCALFAHAQSEERHYYDIPALPINKAVSVFARRNRNLGAVALHYDARHTPTGAQTTVPLRGWYTTEEAFRLLLSQTCFKAERFYTHYGNYHYVVLPDRAKCALITFPGGVRQCVPVKDRHDWPECYTKIPLAHRPPERSPTPME